MRMLPDQYRTDCLVEGEKSLLLRLLEDQYIMRFPYPSGEIESCSTSREEIELLENEPDFEPVDE